MKIAIVSPEVVPFSKTGGLADVAGSLPAALTEMGHEVTVITPLYETARKNAEDLGVDLSRVDGSDFSFTIGNIDARGSVVRAELPGSSVPVYFLKNEHYYGRPGLYVDSENHEDYPDNPERFIFFCQGAMEACREMDFDPDVFHCQEWQTGLLPLYLRHTYRDQFPGAGSVLTVHNLAYQGRFPEHVMELTGLPRELFNWKQLEYYGQVSFLKGGLVSADIVNTVSENYAREIQTEEYGMGLHGVLQERGEDVHGIINGVDYTTWTPETDEHLPENYSEADLSGKAECKEALQEEAGLPPKIDAPLVGMIGRLADQKGVDLVADAFGRLMDLGLQLVVLGTGEPKYHRLLEKMEQEYPDNVSAFLRFDEPLAHRIEAGADMFLMPSRFEPCGLNQLYSMKYGTVPVVSSTGGLVDTVVQYSKETMENGTATGFRFEPGDTDDMVAALQQGCSLFEDHPDRWKKLQKICMDQDWSWNKSARKYAEIYREASEKAGKTAVQA